MNSPSQSSKKRRAIYYSLKQHLEQDQLMQAMLIWQEKYAEKPGFAVRHFAEEVYEITHRKVTPKILVNEMVLALTSPNPISEDPEPLIERYRTEHRITTIRDSAPVSAQQITALTVLLGKIKDLTESRLHAQLNQAIIQKLYDSEIAPDLKMPLVRWLEDDKQILRPNHLEIKDLRAVVTLCYSAYCVSIGPVKTDALFAEALKRLESNGGAIYSTIFKQLM